MTTIMKGRQGKREIGTISQRGKRTVHSPVAPAARDRLGLLNVNEKTVVMISSRTRKTLRTMIYLWRSEKSNRSPHKMSQGHDEDDAIMHSSNGRYLRASSLSNLRTSNLLRNRVESNREYKFEFESSRTVNLSIQFDSIRQII